MKFERRTSILTRPLRSRLTCIKLNVSSIYRMGLFSGIKKALLTHQIWWVNALSALTHLHGQDPSLALPSSQELQGSSTSIPLLRWGVRGTWVAWVVAGNFYAPSWASHFQIRYFFIPHRGTFLHRLGGTGCRRLSACLTLLQDDDSRDRVSPVLRAAAGVQGAEALVGCVHGLSLRRHADDRCIWVHITGKSNGTEVRRMLSGVLKEHHK